ncbi:sugar kinase [Microbacterium sp. STN6]|uniref:sugar kinase n=1 Tax=Microbacterium sp. STN6 TaxID=2995588 RepID=UPI002260A591|nr:sugar kinase [Microbacterium sp. STN6]MCX7523168.1 sugar kinase [Microbacterium sp. STN6]
MSGVVTIGETMALMAGTQPGPLQHSPTMSLGIGGSESNVAIALSRLGVETTWIGRVGADALGDLVLREIGAEGVRVIASRDPDATTGIMIKERRSALDTRIWYYRVGLAGSRLSVDDVDFSIVRDAALLHVTGISPALSPSMSTVIDEAIRVARKAGVPVSFDLNFRGRLWSREQAGEAYRRIIPEVDLVFGGDDEAAIALGHTAEPLALAHDLVELGAGQAVVKLGERGAVAAVEGQEYERAAIRVPVVDTVGAGDAFVAGYLAEYLAGESVETRLTTAVTVGAYACLTPGDWEGLPRRAELAALTATEPVTR